MLLDVLVVTLVAITVAITSFAYVYAYHEKHPRVMKIGPKPWRPTPPLKYYPCPGLNLFEYAPNTTKALLCPIGYTKVAGDMCSTIGKPKKLHDDYLATKKDPRYKDILARGIGCTQIDFQIPVKDRRFNCKHKGKVIETKPCPTA